MVRRRKEEVQNKEKNVVLDPQSGDPFARRSLKSLDAGPLRTVRLNSRNLERNYSVSRCCLVMPAMMSFDTSFDAWKNTYSGAESSSRGARQGMQRVSSQSEFQCIGWAQKKKLAELMCLTCAGTETRTFLEGKKTKAADESADAGLTMQYCGMFVLCCLSFVLALGTRGHFGELKEVAKTERQLNRNGRMAGGGFRMFQKCKFRHCQPKNERADVVRNGLESEQKSMKEKTWLQVTTSI